MCTISTDHILTRYTQLSIDNDNKEEQYIRLISKMGRNRNHNIANPMLNMAGNYCIYLCVQFQLIIFSLNILNYL